MSQLIEVRSTEFKQVFFPDRIYTDATLTCVAIGFYDAEERLSWLAHEDNAQYDDNLNNYIDEILKESRAEDLKIWVTGAAYQDDEGENELVDINRSYVTAILEKRFSPSQLHFAWSKNNHYASIQIDTRIGEASIEMFPMGEEKQDSASTDFIWNAIVNSAKRKFDYNSFAEDFNEINENLAENVLFKIILGFASEQTSEIISLELFNEIMMMGLFVKKEDIRIFVAGKDKILNLEIYATQLAGSLLQDGKDPVAVLDSVNQLLN